MRAIDSYVFPDITLIMKRFFSKLVRKEIIQTFPIVFRVMLMDVLRAIIFLFDKHIHTHTHTHTQRERGMR